MTKREHIKCSAEKTDRDIRRADCETSREMRDTPDTYTLKQDVAIPAVKASIDFATSGGDGYRYCVVTATDKNGEKSIPGSEIKFYMSAGTAMKNKPEENGAPGSDMAKLVESSVVE